MFIPCLINYGLIALSKRGLKGIAMFNGDLWLADRETKN